MGYGSTTLTTAQVPTTCETHASAATWPPRPTNDKRPSACLNLANNDEGTGTIKTTTLCLNDQHRRGNHSGTLPRHRSVPGATSTDSDTAAGHHRVIALCLERPAQTRTPQRDTTASSLCAWNGQHRLRHRSVPGTASTGCVTALCLARPAQTASPLCASVPGAASTDTGTTGSTHTQWGGRGPPTDGGMTTFEHCTSEANTLAARAAKGRWQLLQKAPTAQRRPTSCAAKRPATAHCRQRIHRVRTTWPIGPGQGGDDQVAVHHYAPTRSRSAPTELTAAASTSTRWWIR